MATQNSLNVAQLEATLGKLGSKLARQQGAVKDTEAHMAALRQLVEQLKATK